MLKIKRFLEFKKCSSCNKEFLAYEVQKINSQDYVCRECKRVNNYCTRNNNYKGKESKISFSFEFETSSRANALYELRKYNFIGCTDGSIGGLEWKSVIFYSRKSFHHICRKIDKFAKYVGADCGTHLHVSTDFKTKIDQYKRQIFQPLLNKMIVNREKTEKFWGRYFGHYCQSVIYDDYRYNAFNTVSSVSTLEFRLLKFINAEQYIRACDFCIDTTRYINNLIGSEDFNNEKARKMGEIIAQKYEEVTKNV
ncbi:MAG: hypothetical protein HFJ26_01790 [Clostridia bacterium]|nr:hypothetical protein [Clostridia bacterium]